MADADIYSRRLRLNLKKKSHRMVYQILDEAECSGNQLIVDVSRALVKVFGHENCYRIGGDEFAVIVKDMNRFKCSERKQEFINQLQQNDDGISPSAAVGYAFYDKDTDESWEAVFKRADKEMYKEKQEMKSRKESSFLKS